MAGLFLMLFHLSIYKADYNRLFTTISSAFHLFKTDSEHECNKMSLQENNKTPIKCNSNYCSNSSPFFTVSFPSFGFEKFIGKEVSGRFFLYNDPPYSSFFNSIWIPPKI
ncbi:hypothetical protein DRF67_15815 [Chryseobacterium pennipullorum]|uniref:Uncharacterized protein n=1 Tax=Chryseobacterium pennipullorum TaxID=2258963 RepID=A0A3D9AVZ1_9FLAO|nr:hypothetical protein DRF67_15815 [Chryseobacterium pennipullorum]